MENSRRKKANLASDGKFSEMADKVPLSHPRKGACTTVSTEESIRDPQRDELQSIFRIWAEKTPFDLDPLDITNQIANLPG